MAAAAWSSMVRLMLLTGVLPQASDMTTTEVPAGLTSSTSRSAGNAWVRPFSFRSTSVMLPDTPDTEIGAGYGAATPEPLAPKAGTVIGAAAAVVIWRLQPPLTRPA